MKSSSMIRRSSLFLILLMIVLILPGDIMAAQAPINLGTTESFAVLAGQTVTNTGTTTINGDAGGNVGVSPGSALSDLGFLTISGALHLGDDVALKAQDDLVIAYDDAAGRTPVTRIPSQLGETTLKPGTYDSEDGTFQITGTLYLDAEGDPDGVFVFLTRYTLITASGSNVSLLNSARYCRIFWKVGSSATLGTDSYFVGHIFALTSISAQRGATIQGQLMARNGSVTLDSNTITNGICASAATPTPTAEVTTTLTPTPAEAAAATTAATTAAPTATSPLTATTTATTTATPTTVSETTETVIKTGEPGNIIFIVIGMSMLGLAGGLLLALQHSRRQTRTVTPNSDYREQNQKK